MNKTKISWTDYTSNPIRARDKRTGKIGWWCSHASTGCLHCYSETLNKRYGNQVPYHAQEADYIEFVLNEKEFDKWEKLPEGAKCFAFDMIDLFHERMPDDFIFQALSYMRDAAHVTFQVLTKRAERMRDVVTRYYNQWIKVERAFELESWIPFNNVWLGVSVENQKAVYERIPLLLQTPAPVRFLSCEPLLESIVIASYIFPNANNFGRAVDWVICGGESGPHFRPMNLDWARGIKNQCVAANVPFFFKQSSAYRSETGTTLDGVEWHQFPGRSQ